MDIGNNTKAPNGDYKIGNIEWGPRKRELYHPSFAPADMEAQLWAVFIRGAINLTVWVANFHTRDDCELFVGAMAVRDNQRGES